MKSFLVVFFAVILISQSFTMSFGQWTDYNQHDPGTKGVMPDWFKTNAKWWKDGLISDADMINALESLMIQDVIPLDKFVKPTSGIDYAQDSTKGDSSIPSYQKDVFGFWSDGIVSDDEIVNSIGHLMGKGIINSKKIQEKRQEIDSAIDDSENSSLNQAENIFRGQYGSMSQSSIDPTDTMGHLILVEKSGKFSGNPCDENSKRIHLNFKFKEFSSLLVNFKGTYPLSINLKHLYDGKNFHPNNVLTDLVTNEHLVKGADPDNTHYGDDVVVGGEKYTSDVFKLIHFPLLPEGVHVFEFDTVKWYDRSDGVEIDFVSNKKTSIEVIVPPCTNDSAVDDSEGYVLLDQYVSDSSNLDLTKNTIKNLYELNKWTEVLATQLLNIKNTESDFYDDLLDKIWSTYSQSPSTESMSIATELDQVQQNASDDAIAIVKILSGIKEISKSLENQAKILGISQLELEQTSKLAIDNLNSKKSFRDIQNIFDAYDDVEKTKKQLKNVVNNSPAPWDFRIEIIKNPPIPTIIDKIDGSGESAVDDTSPVYGATPNYGAGSSDRTKDTSKPTTIVLVTEKQKARFLNLLNRGIDYGGSSQPESEIQYYPPTDLLEKYGSNSNSKYLQTWINLDDSLNSGLGIPPAFQIPKPTTPTESAVDDTSPVYGATPNYGASSSNEEKDDPLPGLDYEPTFEENMKLFEGTVDAFLRPVPQELNPELPADTLIIHIMIDANEFLDELISKYYGYPLSMKIIENGPRGTITHNADYVDLYYQSGELKIKKLPPGKYSFEIKSLMLGDVDIYSKNDPPSLYTIPSQTNQETSSAIPESASYDYVISVDYPMYLYVGDQVNCNDPIDKHLFGWWMNISPSGYDVDSGVFVGKIKVEHTDGTIEYIESPIYDEPTINGKIDAGPPGSTAYAMLEEISSPVGFSINFDSSNLQPITMTTPPCTNTDDSAEFEKVDFVASYLINGKYFPIYQFIYSEPDACSSPHYHSATGTALSTDFVTINDPSPNGCGFGTTSMIPQYPQMTESDILEWESITGIDIPDN